MPTKKLIKKRSRQGGITTHQLQRRLEAFSQEDEERRRKIREAKELFLWRLRPIIGFIQDTEGSLTRTLQGMGDFIPLNESPIDMVTAKLAEEANLAHRLLLEEEIKGTRDIQEFWRMAVWKDYPLESFQTRIGQIGSGKVQFVLWVGKANNKEAVELINRIYDEAPEFLDY